MSDKRHQQRFSGHLGGRTEETRAGRFVSIGEIVRKIVAKQNASRLHSIPAAFLIGGLLAADMLLYVM